MVKPDPSRDHHSSSRNECINSSSTTIKMYTRRSDIHLTYPPTYEEATQGVRPPLQPRSYMIHPFVVNYHRQHLWHQGNSRNDSEPSTPTTASPTTSSRTAFLRLWNRFKRIFHPRRRQSTTLPANEPAAIFHYNQLTAYTPNPLTASASFPKRHWSQTIVDNNRLVTRL
jgi:hypothetical protein